MEPGFAVVFEVGVAALPLFRFIVGYSSRSSHSLFLVCPTGGLNLGHPLFL